MDLQTVTAFTPGLSLLGGAMIGLSAVMLMAFFGRIAGISGITAGAVFSASYGQNTWRLPFLAGLIAAPLLYALVSGGMPQQTVPDFLPGMAAAGLIVGLGTALGSGCTSGHGVCGLSRLSPRSLAAVFTFMAVAALTVFVLRHLV